MNDENLVKTYLTVSDIAVMFGVEETTVREWIKNNEIPSKKIGQKWYFRQEDIDRLFEMESRDITGGDRPVAVTIVRDDQE